MNIAGRRRIRRSSWPGANRSKSSDARKAGHDVQPNRSNSICDLKRMRHGQEAVANAVISGHHPGSVIPYIDDISSPVEKGAANNQHPKARRMSATTDQRAWNIGTIHRSNSADVRSYVVPEVSPATLRKARASSVDRSTAKGVHRRSYQIATMANPKSDKRSVRKRSPKPSQKNNLQVKDVDGSRRFKWSGSFTKIFKKFGTGQPSVLNGTFGVHLEDCPTSVSNEFVPFIVELCCRIVEERGLHFTWIYRIPGNNASVSALQDDLNNRGAESIQPDDERLGDLKVVSSLMKSFFRKLPQPLFTNELYHDFIQANRKPTPESRLNGLRNLVHMLPGPQYETLKYLITHLRLVADNCESNKMEVRNLAIVFGPTLVRNTATDDTTTMVTDMHDQCRIIESIIDQAEWFFSDACEPAPDISRTVVPAEREHQAVPNIEFLLDNVGRKSGDTDQRPTGHCPNACWPVFIDENHPPADVNERLVGELPKPEYPTSLNSTRSQKFNTSSDPVSKQKRRKRVLRENFTLQSQITVGAPSVDAPISRCDPKRRGMVLKRGSENDQPS